MKGIKIFLGVVIVLLLIAIGFTVYVWYTLQSLKTPAPSVLTETEIVEPQENTTTAPAPIVIEKSDMSESQQKALETLGFTQESYTITPTMVNCAEEAVGKTRLAEITGGTAPTPLESIKLLPCFKK